MIHFLNHFKGIAYFLAMLILFQSCIAYSKNSSTIEEASSEKDMSIKIITKDGNKYKLNWIEEKDGKIFSIKKTKRVYFNKEDIAQIVLLDPEPRVITLDLAVQNHGTFQLLMKDDKGRYNSHKFIRISERDGIITGYKMTGKDFLTVIIPIDQIEMIQLKNKKKSAGRTVGLIVGVGIGVGIIIFVASGGFNIDMGITTQ